MPQYRGRGQGSPWRLCDNAGAEGEDGDDAGVVGEDEDDAGVLDEDAAGVVGEDEDALGFVMMEEDEDLVGAAGEDETILALRARTRMLSSSQARTKTLSVIVGEDGDLVGRHGRGPRTMNSLDVVGEGVVAGIAWKCIQQPAGEGECATTSQARTRTSPASRARR